MKKTIELGSNVGDLVVSEYLGSINYNNIYRCKCICGNFRDVKLTYLLSESVTNCGCKNFVSKKHGNARFDPQESGFRAKVSNYKAHAKKRGIEFTISTQEASDLLKENCFYCEKSPGNFYNARLRNRANSKNKVNWAVNNHSGYDIHYNGIDRVDNTKGYIPGNVVACCSQCNTAKLTFTKEDFKTWISKVYENLVIKNK